MAYPKPLSEKSLARLYHEANLSQEQSDYLHRLFLACANLYGALELREIWDVHRGQMNVPKLKRKDLIAFSAIARREAQPYYVYEIDELYSAETRADLSRMLVSGELVGAGYGKMSAFYMLMDHRSAPTRYVPGDILSFADKTPTPQEAALRDYLSELKATAELCRPPYGEPYPNQHRGERLKDFSFLNRSERFEEEEIIKGPAALERFRKDHECSEADKIFREYRHQISLGVPLEPLHGILEELQEVGVELSKAEAETLLKLFAEDNNNARLWCLCGWTPTELSRFYGSSGPRTISFGPNMRQMFESGELDRDEVVQKMRELGLEVLD